MCNLIKFIIKQDIDNACMRVGLVMPRMMLPTGWYIFLFTNWISYSCNYSNNNSYQLIKIAVLEAVILLTLTLMLILILIIITTTTIVESHLELPMDVNWYKFINLSRVGDTMPKLANALAPRYNNIKYIVNYYTYIFIYAY